ncbi:hypothetical protein [Saccharothrix sp. NRRL B-16314]|uniref:hypothetical protein n=1 Tax=Saccharothrix sp. NRRL B-16314 TaxID=1463825 RepID=UPI0012DECE98|nr:hypothetical protein [Saccharothrix sp. NRRL B-16314]
MIRTAEPVSATPTRLRAAVGVAVAGALLTAVAPALGVVEDSAPPAFTAWPLLALLALLPAGSAAFFLSRGQESTAAAALVAPAVFAVGRLLDDLQLAVGPIDASRPELLRPTSLLPPTPSAGVWLLLAGHVLLIAAGVGAMATLGAEPDVRSERASFMLPATAGIVAGIGLFTVPFTSSDALVPARGPFDSPTLPMVGGLLVTLAAPALAVLAASATTNEARKGGLLGLAAVLLALALPPIATALAADGIGPAVGPFLVLGAAVALAWPQRAAKAGAEKDKEVHDVELPGARRLHVIAGVLGLVAAAAAVAGASTDHLVLPMGLTPPTDYAARLLWPAAIATAVLAAALIAKAAVRPAFIVATATVPLAAGGALDAVFAATELSAQPGPGVWFTVASVAAAAAAAGTAALAGAVERDEVGVAGAEPPLPLIAGTMIAALLAVGAFALPVLRASDYVPIGAFGLGAGSWGLLVALVAAVVAAGVALKARADRGAALLLGAAVVTGVRALEYPLTAARAAGAVPGPGLWLAAAATAAFLVSAALRTAR